MDTFIPSIEVVRSRSLRESIDLFLENQLNYCSKSKVQRIESFKADLIHKINSEGLTDDNLLLGLELNSYLRQVYNNEGC